MSEPMAYDIGGRINVRVRVSDGRVDAVNVLSSRPPNPSRVLIGKPARDLPAMVGLLFSLCRRAQAIACLTAVERAGRITVSAPQSAAREIMRLAEMASQTLLRLCMDWPRVLGIDVRPEPVRACLAAEAGLERALFGGEEWKIPGGTRLRPRTAEVAAHIGAIAEAVGTTVADEGLAPALREALAQSGLDGFGAVKTARDGALGRQWDQAAVVEARTAFGAGLTTRLEARIADLGTVVTAMTVAETEISDASPVVVADDVNGRGEAEVVTVRGPLRHAVELRNGVATDYRIDVPTDRHFAAGGVVEAGLLGAGARDAARLARAAALYVLALDPCVMSTVEVDNA